MLVPEINLTPQLVAARARGAARACALRRCTAGSPHGERRDALAGGGDGRRRSSCSARASRCSRRCRALGLVVVDEEHDASYKQQDNVRYHARDVAIWRAQRRGVPVVLGSATPSLETLAARARGRYRQARSCRGAPIRARALPPVRLRRQSRARAHDGIGEPLRDGDRGAARARRAVAGVRQPPRLRAVAHVLGVRVGSAAARAAARGSPCIATPPSLRCHHCGHAERAAAGVPDVRQRRPRAARASARSASSARSRRRFPRARIARVDRDSTRAQAARSRACATRSSANALDILVGTQMLAKGHDFPRLTLVGVLGADNALYSADFRATERLAALLVAGRGPRGPRRTAGRSHRADRLSRPPASTRRSRRTTTRASPKRCSASAKRASCRRSRTSALLARGGAPARRRRRVPARGARDRHRAGSARTARSRCSRRCRRCSRAARASSAASSSCRASRRAALQRFLPRGASARRAARPRVRAGRSTSTRPASVMAGAETRQAIDQRDSVIDSLRQLCGIERASRRIIASPIAIDLEAEPVTDPKANSSSALSAASPRRCPRTPARRSRSSGRSRPRTATTRPTSRWRSRSARKRNPRELAAGARRGAARVARSSSAPTVAGAGFINIMLTPAARQAIVKRVLTERARVRQVAARAPASASWSSSCRRIPPARCTSATAGRRRWAMRSPSCSSRRAAAVTREFYYNDAGQQIQNLAVSVRARAKEILGETGGVSRGRLPRRVHPRDRAALPRRGRATTCPTSRRSATSRWRSCARSRTATCARSASSSTTTTSRARCTPTAASTRRCSACVASGKTYEHEGALWLRTTDYGDDKDRVMRKSDGGVHVLRARRRLSRHQVGARLPAR